MSGHRVVDHAARLEDLRFMADTGESLTGAARRLGMTPDGIEKWARLRGELELFARLRARDPIADVDIDRRAISRANADQRYRNAS